MGYRPWGHRELAVTELNNSAVLEAPESLLPFPHPHRSLLTEEPPSLALSGSLLTVPPLCSSHLLDAIFPF